MTDRDDHRLVELLYDEVPSPKRAAVRDALGRDDPEGLAQLEGVLRAVRSVPDEEPSAMLDAKILAAARDTAAQVRPSGWRRFAATLLTPSAGLAAAGATAAVAAIVILPLGVLRSVDRERMMPAAVNEAVLADRGAAPTEDLAPAAPDGADKAGAPRIEAADDEAADDEADYRGSSPAQKDRVRADVPRPREEARQRLKRRRARRSETEGAPARPAKLRESPASGALAQRPSAPPVVRGQPPSADGARLSVQKGGPTQAPAGAQGSGGRTGALSTAPTKAKARPSAARAVAKVGRSPSSTEPDARSSLSIKPSARPSASAAPSRPPSASAAPSRPPSPSAAPASRRPSGSSDPEALRPSVRPEPVATPPSVSADEAGPPADEAGPPADGARRGGRTASAGKPMVPPPTAKSDRVPPPPPPAAGASEAPARKPEPVAEAEAVEGAKAEEALGADAIGVAEAKEVAARAVPAFIRRAFDRARVWEAAGKQEEARRVYRQTLTRAQREFPRRPALATVLLQFAEFELRQKRPAEARALAQRALAIPNFAQRDRARRIVVVTGR